MTDEKYAAVVEELEELQRQIMAHNERCEDRARIVKNAGTVDLFDPESYKFEPLDNKKDTMEVAA